MNKTIVVLLDACRYDAATKYLGYLEHMVDAGFGAKYRVQGELPSLSKSMYATVFSGVPTYEHGVTCNEVTKKLTCPNVFSLCRENGGITAAAAYSWMSELYNHIPFSAASDRIQLDSDGSIQHGIFYWEDTYPDSHVFADGEYLRMTYQPDLLLYHTMAIDLQGHLHGGDSAEYANAVANVGNMIAVLMPKWLEAGYQVVVTADHGMDAQGIHVGTEASQRDVALYIFSEKIPKGRFEEAYISQLDIAPKICELLGIASVSTVK